MKFWFSRDAEHCLVVNNDVLLRPDTYRLLLTHGGPFVTAVGNDDPECVKSLDPPVVPPRKHPDFSCYLIRTDVWDKVGPYNEDYAGGYCEDAEYHIRMHKAGIDAICIDTPFYHLGAGTVKCSDQEEQGAIHAAAHANRVRFEKDYGVVVGTPEYYKLFES